MVWAVGRVKGEGREGDGCTMGLYEWDEKTKYDEYP